MIGRFLSLSDGLRPGYAASLGTSSANEWATVPKGGLSFPSFFDHVYSVVRGTAHQTSEQKMADFLPGYRLVHMSELVGEIQAMRGVYQDDATAIPFLANYSSDYICWLDGRIISFVHDDPVRYLMHESETDFWETICAFYEEGVYRLVDGFLDADFDVEATVGSRLNPGVAYWA